MLHASLVSPLLLLVLVLLLPALAIYLLCQVLLYMKLFIVPCPFKMVPIQNRMGGGYNNPTARGYTYWIVCINF